MNDIGMPNTYGTSVCINYVVSWKYNDVMLTWQALNKPVYDVSVMWMLKGFQWNFAIEIFVSFWFFTFLTSNFKL